MPEVGRLAVCLALLFAAYGVLAGVAGGLRRRAHLVRSAEHAACAVFGLVVIATAILLRALLRHDFTLEYVAAYSSSTLPTQYTVAALWGGQKGSLLFWSFLLTLFTTIVQVQNRERNRALMPFVTATLMTVAVFFLSLLVFVTDPFERLPVAAREGADLNPLLQNYWMMIHPPSLYTGYVSASVPFAFAMAARLPGRVGDALLTMTRRWTIVAWYFLSLGLLIGGWWSYHVLGWGGYWAWDPVENAAFMPWLTATAFLHSVMIQERRRMLKLWNLALVIMTFGLTLFGTFLTRSGVIASVHAFTQGTIGAFFLGFLALVLLTALGLLAWRWDALGAQGALDSVVSRESAFLLNNVMLVAAAFTVFFGTVFPLLSEALRGVKVSVGAPFFNQVNVPLFLGLIFLMGVGPLIAWRRATVDNLRRNFLGPVLTGVAAATFFFALGVRSALAVLTLALTVFVAATSAPGRTAPPGDGRAPPSPQPPLRRLRRPSRHPDHRGRRHGLAGVVGADRDDARPRPVRGARRLPRALRRPHGLRGVEPLQGRGHLHRLGRSRPRRPATREEVLPPGAVADRLRGLPARAPRGHLPRPRRLRPRRLAGDGQVPGEPPRELDLDRRPRPHGRGRARDPAGDEEDRVSRRPWRWLIPLAELPVLALLAYGFRVDPRAIPSPLVGRPAPGFTLTAFDGTPLGLEAQRGRVVVLNFWASWCYPACYEEAPVLERSWRAYRDRGVLVVGVDIQDTVEAARKFMRDFGLSFPNAPDPTGKVSVDYGTYGVRETFFLDRRGRIRAKHVGALTDEVVRTHVERLLAEPAS